MAKKRQKTTRFSIQSYDAAHYRQTEQYTQAVEALFDRATAEITRAAAKGTYDPEKPFSFDDYPGVKSVMQDVTKQLASRMITVVETGSKKQWLFACDKNDGFIESIMDTSKVSKARLRKMQDRNLEALQMFQQRKVEGMNLSQRVWKYVGQYKDQLESALDVGLGEGRSADQLSRDVRENLKEPNRLFRRVRDKRGNLVLSKAARAFHPGQGVYRSSYKNAMRLTRSEINMAYRESDFLRWQSLDFVVGFEIHRSNHEPLCKCDLCERLVGRYPKTFKFKGWHPQCMCYATPILMDEETFDENELGDLKAALRGTQYKPLQAKNVVTDVPDEFKKWVKDHIEAQKNWGSTPYFIKDNFKDGKLSEGLKIALPTVQVQTDVLAPYRAQIEQARQQATKWGLSVQLTMLDKYVADKDIASIQSRIATIQSKAAQMEQADADIRRKCAEWGLSTYILDEAMRNPDSKNILAKMSELEDRCINAERERKAFISDANDAVKEARKLGIDVSDMLNWISIVSDKREWVMSKTRANEVLESLKSAIASLKTKGNDPMDEWAKRTQSAGTINKSANDVDIEKSFGIQKGVDMTFDEANELRGNPNFEPQYIPDPNGIYIRRSDGQRLSKNPKYKKKFTVNCQSCVVAHELRRRGFDVQAQGNTKGSTPEILSYHTELAWLDANGNAPTSRVARSQSWDLKEELAQFYDLTKDVGRYHIKWSWDRSRSGHIITCERLSDGTLRIYDPQNGEFITDFEAYAKGFKRSRGIEVLRVDNLRFNVLYSGALKGNKARKKGK
ncbi:MAG: hypothetical protein J5989_08745 [Alistipes sp.]|nr:hypothetical protein [Alistipes sp.]